MYAQQVAKSYDNFYFKEKYYFSIFHEHKNTKLNHFHIFQKEINFRVLHPSSSAALDEAFHLSIPLDEVMSLRLAHKHA